MASPIPTKLVPEVATIIDNTDGRTYSFPFNVNTLEFSYQMNNQSFSTIGGRVTQLLSVRMNTMSLEGDAGNRENLLKLYENFKTVQDHQNQKKVAMTLNIPSRSLSFNVFLEQMEMGFDLTTIIYPYSIFFEISQDLSGNKNLDKAMTIDALNRLAQGIGYNTDYLGLTTNKVNVNYSSLYSALSNNGTLSEQG